MLNLLTCDVSICVYSLYDHRWLVHLFVYSSSGHLWRGYNIVDTVPRTVVNKVDQTAVSCCLYYKEGRVYEKETNV